MQNYVEIENTKSLTESRAMILNNDKTIMSCSAGTVFPTADLQLGMLCYRTDQKKLYQLIAVSPAAEWKILMDQNIGWVEGLPRAGGQMTGLVSLFGNPSDPMHAATKQYVDSATPAGATMMFAASIPPGGWLKANGAAVSRTTFATLFSALGTLYGAGDGATTFNLPDLRGLVIRGWDDGRGFDPNRAFGVFQDSQNLWHTHGVTDPGHGHGFEEPLHSHSGSTNWTGDHGHGYNQTAYSGVGAGSAGFLGNLPTGNGGATTTVSGGHAHTFSTNAVRAGAWIHGGAAGISIQGVGGDEVRMKNMALLACIKY